MQKIIKNSVLLCFFVILLSAILCYPKESLAYALNGLNTWFERMIPTLFPFMVLTGIIIRMQLTQSFARLFRPLLFPLLHLPGHCLYVVAMGFLCGFPMGAKIIGDMYRLRQLSKEEATYLLAFCNNIGPVFFTGFVFPFLPKTYPAVGYLFGMYGIPLCYGMFLRYYRYGKHFSSGERFALYQAPAIQKPPSFAATLDASVSSAIQSITKLGGYMIFFNLLNLLPQLTFNGLSTVFSGLSFATYTLQIFSGLLLEITGGIVLAGSSCPILLLSMLQFGGISCFAQTYSMISDTDIPLSSYLFHKGVQTILAFGYYCILFQL